MIPDLLFRPIRRSPSVIFLIAIVCAIMGLLITFAPQLAFAFALATVFLILSTIRGLAEGRIVLPLCLIFLIPADRIDPLAGDRAGFLCLGIGVLLVVGSVIRLRLRPSSQLDKAFLAFVAASVAMYVVHASKGAIRGGLFAVAGALISLWLAGESTIAPRITRRGIEFAFCLAGALSGAVGVLEHLGLFDPAAVIPYYQGERNQFTYLLGVRAVGLSGHALHLGTITMLASVILLVRLITKYRSNAPSWTSAGLLACSFVGLVVSGARGSWLGLVAGLTAALAPLAWRGESSRAVRLFRMGLISVVLAFLLATSGIGRLIGERISGSAAAPVSIGQRVLATNTVLDAFPDIPFIGVGPGATAQFLLRWGLIVPNLESEYLIALVGFGPLGLAMLLAFVAHRVLRAGQRSKQESDYVPIAILIAFLVNLGTYNLLSWSDGFVMFACISFICDKSKSEASTETSDDSDETRGDALSARTTERTEAVP